MKLKLIFMIVAVCSLAANSQTRVNSRQTVKPAQILSSQLVSNGQTLPIRRVILYSNGVAYIERRGVVSGRAEINLAFKQSQVDDVLKSMLVLDLGQGKIGAVSYNSSAPAGARMAEIPFSVESNTDGATGGMAGVLAQLQGARVSIVSIKGAAIGSILTVEKRDIKSEDGKSVVSARFLVIASENGEISSFDLSEVRSIKLLDEGTRKDLNEFASASASARRRDAKTITVTSEGAGQREMVVSYTIAAPIWKTTYRVVLDTEGKPFFQGWAIVDNVSDEDWSNVQLSLVSGTPVSFIQPIQNPFYRYRPVVPIPSDLKLSPQVYESGVSNNEESGPKGIKDGDNSPTSSEVVSRQVQSLSMNGRNMTQELRLSAGASVNNTVTVDGQETAISTVLTSGSSGVETAATGEEVGDLFEYRIEQPMTVKRDRSALIPIIQTKMEGERVSIYNPSVRRDRPMSGMLLKNLTSLTFESGSMTVIDGNAYAGEALMERLKPKEQRLISFALDLGTLVTTEEDGNVEPARLVKAANGAIEINYFKLEKKTYTLTNQSDRSRVVYIEHPVRDDWELSDETIKPTTQTQKYYRFRVELEPFGKKVFPIVERQDEQAVYGISNITREQINLFVSQKYINDATRRRLEQLLDLKAQIEQIRNKIVGLDNETRTIAEDQKRFRENIEALSKTPEAKTLITRYIAKADEQETRIEQISKERQTLQAEQARLENELAAAIRAFEI